MLRNRLCLFMCVLLKRVERFFYTLYFYVCDDKFIRKEEMEKNGNVPLLNAKEV